MKILILNDVAATVGGAEIMTYHLRAELRRRGHDARVFASRAFGEGPADYTCFGSASRLRTLHRTANPRAARRLRGVLASFRPDIVHARMFLTQLSPLILPLLRQVPCLYHASTYELLCPTVHKLLPNGSVCRVPAGRACLQCLSPQAWTALMMQRGLTERWRQVFDLYVANSDTTRRRLDEAGYRPVVRVWNGIPARPPRPPLTGPPTVAYAGRWSREKGVDTLVEAFTEVARRVPDARLLVLGDGASSGAVQRKVAAEGTAERVILAGHLPREATERALESAWVQAAPSALEETFGLAVAEAMMRGTAVVATDHGGPAELVGPAGGGLLVPPGDASALAEALVALLGDRERAESMGAAGRVWAIERLGVETCVDRFVELYQALVARRAA